MGQIVRIQSMHWNNCRFHARMVPPLALRVAGLKPFNDEPGIERSASPRLFSLLAFSCRHRQPLIGQSTTAIRRAGAQHARGDISRSAVFPSRDGAGDFHRRDGYYGCRRSAAAFACESLHGYAPQKSGQRGAPRVRHSQNAAANDGDRKARGVFVGTTRARPAPRSRSTKRFASTSCVI